MSVFEEMAKAQVQGRGQSINEDDDFVVRIDRIKMQASNQGFGLLWIVEFTVLKGTEANPRESARSWVQKPEKRPQTDPGNIKAFVAVLEGHADPTKADMPAETFERAASDAQPYTGRVLRLRTQVVQTRAGFDFTVHNWQAPLDGDEALAADVPPPSEKETFGGGSAIAGGTTPVAGATAADGPPPPPPGAPALTKERWLAGAGEGKAHPDAPGYEYHPQHTDWGCRKKA